MFIKISKIIPQVIFVIVFTIFLLEPELRSWPIQALTILSFCLVWRSMVFDTMLVKKQVENIFNHFDWESLEEEEKEVLSGGIEKHTRIMKTVLFFIPFQLALTILAPDIMSLLTAASFIALMLGTAWYAISFQNVSQAQLVAGVADYITERMFKAFLLAFSILPLGMTVFTVKTLFPELISVTPVMVDISIVFRITLLIVNIMWVLEVWKNVYTASVSYDGTDSLLGDGFPRLMRGALATASNLPILKEILEAVRELKKSQAL